MSRVQAQSHPIHSRDPPRHTKEGKPFYCSAKVIQGEAATNRAVHRIFSASVAQEPLVCITADNKIKMMGSAAPLCLHNNLSQSE